MQAQSIDRGGGDGVAAVAEPKAQSTPPMVVLVHGTWGSESTWTREGSTLRSALGEALPPGTQYRLFTWSGANSHQARMDAGAALSLLLQDCARSQPHQKLFLVTHSHGGNVALYAVKDLMLRGQPDGVIGGIVAIATPFIHVRRRTLTEGMKNLLRLFSLVASMGLIVTLATGLDGVNRLLLGESLWAIPVMLVLAGGGIGLVDVTLELTHTWIRQLSRRQADMFAKLSLQSPSSLPMLAVSIAGDEARGWLTVLRHVANMPAHAFAIIGHTARFQAALSLLIACVCLTVIAAGGWSGFDATPLTRVGGIALTLVGGLVGGWFLGALLQIPMWVVPKLVRGHAGGFGGETVLQNWLLDIYVSESGPLGGSCEARRFSAADLGAGRRAPLLHSGLYESTRVCSEIASWLRQRC